MRRRTWGPRRGGRRARPLPAAPSGPRLCPFTCGVPRQGPRRLCGKLDGITEGGGRVTSDGVRAVILYQRVRQAPWKVQAATRTYPGTWVQTLVPSVQFKESLSLPNRTVAIKNSDGETFGNLLEPWRLSARAERGGSEWVRGWRACRVAREGPEQASRPGRARRGGASLCGATLRLWKMKI